MNLEDLETSLSNLVATLRKEMDDHIARSAVGSTQAIQKYCSVLGREIVYTVMAPKIANDIATCNTSAMKHPDRVTQMELEASYQLLMPHFDSLVEMVLQSMTSVVDKLVRETVLPYWHRVALPKFSGQVKVVTRDHVRKYQDHMYGRYLDIQQTSLKARSALADYAAEVQAKLSTALSAKPAPPSSSIPDPYGSPKMKSPLIMPHLENDSPPPLFSSSTAGGLVRKSSNLTQQDVVEGGATSSLPRRTSGISTVALQALRSQAASRESAAQAYKQQLDELREKYMILHGQVTALEHTIQTQRQEHADAIDKLKVEFEKEKERLFSEHTQAVVKSEGKCEEMETALHEANRWKDVAEQNDNLWKERSRRLTLEVLWLSMTLSRVAGPTVLQEVEKRLQGAPLENLDIHGLQKEQQVFLSEIQHERTVQYVTSAETQLAAMGELRLKILGELERTRRQSIQRERQLIMEHTLEERKLIEENTMLKDKVRTLITHGMSRGAWGSSSTFAGSVGVTVEDHAAPPLPPAVDVGVPRLPSDKFPHMYSGTRVTPRAPPVPQKVHNRISSAPRKKVS
eukprot:PhF_6_TR12628/c3_g1_i1/m.19996